MFAKIHVHTWEDPEIYQMWIHSQVNKNDWPKETWKKCSIEVIQTTAILKHSLSLSLPLCFILFFPPNKYFTCFTTFCLCENSSSAKSRSQGLSSTTGLAVRSWYSHPETQPQSLAESQSPASSHCRQRPPKIIPNPSSRAWAQKLFLEREVGYTKDNF